MSLGLDIFEVTDINEIIETTYWEHRSDRPQGTEKRDSHELAGLF